MDVSRDTPHVTTKPKCYDLTNILVGAAHRKSLWPIIDIIDIIAMIAMIAIITTIATIAIIAIMIARITIMACCPLPVPVQLPESRLVIRIPGFWKPGFWERRVSQ